jgi:hypothetical protein
MTTMFQKRHYETIAETLRIERNNASERQRSGLSIAIGALADAFAHDNSNFNRSRFLKACGLEP